MPTAAEYIKRAKKKRSARSNWETLWQSIAERMDPVRATFTETRTPGESPMENSFDSTGMMAARSLAAAIDGLLKPIGDRWFQIRPVDESLLRDYDSVAWMQAVERRMYDAIYAPSAGFRYRTAQADSALTIYGTGGALFIGQNYRENRLSFQLVDLQSLYGENDEEGNVQTLFIWRKMTARDFRRRYGDLSEKSPTVTKALRDNKEDENIEFLQIVDQRDDFDPGRPDRRGKPYMSRLIDVAAEAVIFDNGYHEFPFVVPRWDNHPMEFYGHGPGTIALPDAQTLNAQERTLLEAGQKAVDPPLFVADDALYDAARTYPGGINVFDASVQEQLKGRAIFPLETGANIGLGVEMAQQKREMIFAAFFRNVLQLPVDTPEMTATEVIQRREEMIRVMGPTFARLEADYTNPMVERVYNIMLRANAFPEPPPALRGAELKFVFRGAIQRARDLIDVAAMSKTLNDTAPLIEADPTILDNINRDELFRGVWSRNNVPTDWLMRQEEVDSARDARRQMQEQQAALEQAQMAADAANKAGLQLGQ